MKDNSYHKRGFLFCRPASYAEGDSAPLMLKSYDFIFFTIPPASSARPVRILLTDLVNSWLRSLFTRASRGLAHVLEFFFSPRSFVGPLKLRSLCALHLSAEPAGHSARDEWSIQPRILERWVQIHSRSSPRIIRQMVASLRVKREAKVKVDHRDAAGPFEDSYVRCVIAAIIISGFPTQFESITSWGC